LQRFYDSPEWDDLSFVLDWLPCAIASLESHAGASAEQTRPAAHHSLRRGLLYTWRPELAAMSARALARLELQAGRPHEAQRVLDATRREVGETLPPQAARGLEIDLATIMLANQPQAANDPVPVDTGGIRGDEATLAQVEALLDQQRRLGTGADEAARRIHKAVQSGRWDVGLATAAVASRDTLGALELGAIGDLLVAEGLLDNANYYSASEKYGQFFQAVPDAASRGLARFRYRQGLAALNAGLIEEAFMIIDDLQTHWDPAPDLAAAAVQLRFAAWYGRSQATWTEPVKQQLAASARQVLSGQVTDSPTAEWARMALAMLEGDWPSACALQAKLARAAKSKSSATIAPHEHPCRE
jgi:hypothetical protein